MNITQLLGATSPKVEAERRLPSTSRLQLNPGQQVQAEVISTLPDNKTLMKVAGELLKFDLPVQVKPGETLPLTFLSQEPRLTFSLSRQAVGGTPVELSDPARLLGKLAGSSAPLGTAQLQQTGKVIEGPPTDTGHLAARLRETLTGSGIFYESHLARWSRGEFPLKELMGEPQGRLSSRSKPEAKAGPKPPEQKSLIDTILGVDSEKHLEETTGVEARDLQSKPMDSEELLPILKRQLETLHSGQFVWQGEVWPGQEMEWSVGERESESEEKGEREVETTLRLELPNLGEVRALLRLGPKGISLEIAAAGEETASLMLSDRAALEKAMSAAGVEPAEVVIHHGTGQ